MSHDLPPRRLEELKPSCETYPRAHRLPKRFSRLQVFQRRFKDVGLDSKTAPQYACFWHVLVGAPVPAGLFKKRILHLEGSRGQRSILIYILGNGKCPVASVHANLAGLAGIYGPVFRVGTPPNGRVPCGWNLA